jgi:hypothetical protein
VYHLTRTLAKVMQGHLQALAPFADRYGADIPDTELREHAGPLHGLREKAGVLVGSRPESGLLLLRDLRTLYAAAADASIEWTILGQGAQAARDEELLATVSQCHAEELRVLRWVTTKVKETAPQVLVG